MSGFAHDVAGGDGTLIAKDIHSPNFQLSPLQGWSIDKNGNAFFESVTIGGGVVRVTFASTAPSSPNVGDVWFDLAAGAQPNVWSGSAWTAYQWGTSSIANQAVTNSQLASSVTARSIGGITTTVSGTQPSGSTAGDIWIDTAANNSVWQFDGTSWNQYQWGKLAISPGAVDGTRLNASVTARSLGGITTTISGTQPGSPNTGDIWIDSANGNQLQQWNGSAWTALSWTATDVISAATITGTLIAASTIVGGNIAAGTITAANITAATITGSLIAASTITGGLIAAGTITASNIQAATITASQIAANTITAGQIAAGTITGIYTGAAYFGQNMVQDPAFTSSLLNAVRTGDPVTNATWTLSGGTAAVTAGTPAKRLALMPSGQANFFVTPGEQFYLSITGVTSASCQVGIEMVFNVGGIQTVSATFNGTKTITGTITVPAGAQYGMIRVFAFAGSGSPTATLSNPACYFGQLTGPDWILNSAGYFQYNGTPASGNPPLVAVSAASTDPFGNTIQPGDAGAGALIALGPTPASGTPSFIQLVAGTVLKMLLGTGDTAETAPAGILTQISGSGVGRTLDTTVSSPVFSGGTATELLLASASEDGTTQAPLAALGSTNGQIQASAGQGTLGPFLWWVDSATWGIDRSQSDSSVIPVTQAAFTNITTAWTIPANDPKSGSWYRLTCFGRGVWGSTQQALSFQLSAFGHAVAGFTIGALEFPINTNFSWRLVCEVFIDIAGSGGQMRASIGGGLWNNASSELTNSNTANTAGGFGGATGNTAISTASASTISLQAEWASTTGAPTISGFGSLLERLGA